MTDGTTPLIALDAAVIDTETTGLDPRKARVVELAALRILGGRLDDASFTRLIDPGEPIPPAAARIHGINDARVAGAPAFAAIWQEFSAWLGDTVLKRDATLAAPRLLLPSIQVNIRAGKFPPARRIAGTVRHRVHEETDGHYCVIQTEPATANSGNEAA